MFLIINYSPAPRAVPGAGVKPDICLTKIVRCGKRPNLSYAQAVSCCLKRALRFYYLGEEGVSG
jgi:hypothetical protein